MHVAGAEQAHELVAEMVAVEQDEDDEDDDDADGQQRMQQRRHEGGHALEIRTAAVHLHRRRRARARVTARSWPSEATMAMKRLTRTAAFRQAANILDLLLQVGLVAGEAAGDLGELRHDQNGQQAGDHQRAQHDHRHGKWQRQQTAHPGHCRTQDEGEKHGDRRRDQHVATDIQRR